MAADISQGELLLPIIPPTWELLSFFFFFFVVIFGWVSHSVCTVTVSEDQSEWIGEVEKVAHSQRNARGEGRSMLPNEAMSWEWDGNRNVRPGFSSFIRSHREYSDRQSRVTRMLQVGGYLSEDAWMDCMVTYQEMKRRRWNWRWTLVHNEIQ